VAVVGKAAAAAADVGVSLAARAAAVPVRVHLLVVVEEGGFRCGGGLEGRFCELLVKFAGAPAADAVGDDDEDDGDAD
jgi:hypothetical protein